MKRLLMLLLVVLALPSDVNSEETNVYILKSNLSKTLYREGKFSEMKKICEELIEISPENPDGYLCKGVSLGFARKNERQSREALKNFTKAVKLDPELYEAYFLRGVLQFSMRRREFSKLQTRGCSDIRKAYLNKFAPALEYVNKKKSFLMKNKCSSFF